MDFIDTLEDYHLIHKIDTYVVERVCRDYNEVIEEGHMLAPASVNFSSLDFELCDIFSMVEKTRKKYNVPINMLDLEITETVLKDNPQHIKEECEKMRNIGYQIWLDDFGSGFSSLNNLVEYDFDVLKLDLVFLKNFCINPKTATLISCIVEGAKELGVKTLCEGVETEEQYEFLKKIGCEKAQGFYFGKPMPVNELLAYIREKDMKTEFTGEEMNN